MPVAVATSAIVIEENASASDWDRFVATQPAATGYHRFAWRQVFQRALEHRTHYLLARQDGEVVGVLPLVEVRSVIFGRALSSLPFVNYGGVLAATCEAADALLRHAERIAAERGLSYIILRHRERLFTDLPVRSHKVTMLLPLEKSAEAMWNSLDRKVRNQIRKAEKSNLAAVCGGIELLDEFYSVFARNMRDLGTPVYGRELFAAILGAFPEDARIHLARLDGEVVAGAFSYSYGSVFEVPSASSLREYRALCPNHLLYWSMLQDAIRQGRTTFDFGRSTPNDGTHHFKEQWGAQTVPLHWEYVMTGGGELPVEDRHSPKYQARIDAWKQLPVGFATFLGPYIARAVP